MAKRIGTFIAPMAIAFVTACTRGGVCAKTVAVPTAPGSFLLWRGLCGHVEVRASWSVAKSIGAFIAPVAIAFVTTCTRGGVGPISIAAATSFLWRQQCCRTMFVAPERTILSVAKSIGAIITFVATAFTARTCHRINAISFAEIAMQVLVGVSLCE